jgi:pimeloyl-ACP methyl ester carboxylesterase
MAEGTVQNPDPHLLSLQSTVRADHGVVVAAIERLRAGTLTSGLQPITVSRSIGMGHSLGGMQLIAQQSEYTTFDAVAVLGFSAIHTVVPTQDGFFAPHSTSEHDTKSLEEAWSGSFVDDLAHLRYAYHWEDVPRALVDDDISAGFPVRKSSALPFWITKTFLPFAKIFLQEVVAREAAQIEVPVFIAAGERDVLRDLRQEPLAYGRSCDITLFEISQCAHMHNFSPNREAIWHRGRRSRYQLEPGSEPKQLAYRHRLKNDSPRVARAIVPEGAFTMFIALDRGPILSNEAATDVALLGVVYRPIEHRRSRCRNGSGHLLTTRNHPT